MTTGEDLDKASADYAAMEAYWAQIAAILGGVQTMVAEGEKYLPKHAFEEQATYDYRKKIVKMTNVYRDIVEDLSSRPFQKEVTLGDDTPSEIEEFCMDVDGSGNDVTAFAGTMFNSGINFCVDWLFVDFPKIAQPGDNAPARTREDDKRDGTRPYWTHVHATNVLEVRSRIVKGREVVTYMRIREPAADDKPLQIRILERIGDVAVWSVWIKVSKPTEKVKWQRIDDGVFSIGEIPLTPFVTGRRKGKSWQFDPMLRDAADLQCQLFRDESNLNHAKTLTAFPMISANGVKPEYVGEGPSKKLKPLGTGPGAVLYAPVDGKGQVGSFQLLEIAATSLTFLQGDIDKTIANLRELGRQPLTAQLPGITVITAGVAAMKGNSAVTSWAINAGLTIENALRLTALWLGLGKGYEPKASLFTDFAVEGQQEQMATLTDMRKNGDLSLPTYWIEAQRRGVLSEDFDPDEEEKLLLNEVAEGDDIDPETGDPAPPDPNAPPTDPTAKPPVAAGA